MQTEISENNSKQQKPEPTLKEKTAKGLFWGGMGNLIQQIIGMFLGIVIARILSPGDYGLVGMLAIFTAIANTIMDSGFTTALVNKREIRHEDYNAVFWFGILSGIVLYIFLFFAAPYIANFYKRPELVNLSRLLFLVLLIRGAGFAHNAILIKKLMVKERIKIDITAVSVSGFTGLLLAFNGFAYWSLVIQTVLMSAISIFLRWYYAPWKPSFTDINFNPLKSMFGFSFKLFIANIFAQINGNILSVFLGKYYGKEQVGYYSQGYKWALIGNNVIAGMIDSVVQPVFVEANEDKERQLRIFRKMIRFGAFVSFVTIFGLAFVAREFILITIGDKWIESVPFLQLFCIYIGFNYLMGIYYKLLLSHGKSDTIMWYYIFISLLTLAVVLIMVQYSILFLMIVYVAISILCITGWHYFAGKLIGLRPVHVLKDIFPYLVITGVCFFVAWRLTRNIQNIYLLFTLKIAIVAILYLLIMKYSGSTIFKECMSFLTNRIT
jgi:O-antigen/teichoic acid export membrane protein